MRFMVKVSMPVEAGNEKIRDGSIGQIFQDFLQEHKPEAAYLWPWVKVQVLPSV